MSSILTAQICTNGAWPLAFFFLVSMSFLRWLWIKPLPNSVKALWTYIGLSALIKFEYPYPFFGMYSSVFKSTAAQSFVEVLFVLVGAVFISPYITKILPWAIAITLGFVWIGRPGLMEQSSFDLAFAALAVPLLPIGMVMLVLITLVTHHGTTAALIIGAQILATVVRKKRLSPLLGLVLIILAFAAYRHSGHLFDGSERMMKYHQFMGFWAKQWDWVFLGVGPGSFIWTSISMDKFQAPLFLQMHSDVLQVIWELGLVGFALACWVLYEAVRCAWNKPRVLSALFGFIAFCGPYHPLRFAPTALLSAYIFILAFEINASSMNGSGHPKSKLY